ncbi:MAG: PA14 domain-containing protein [Desulforhopalus sp.]
MTVIYRFKLMLMILCLAYVAGCGGSGGKAESDIDGAMLKPGLSVLYVEGKYRFIKQMPKEKKARKKGWYGKPILEINHQFGEGEVFDSKKSKKIGVLIDGYILLDKQGIYEFQALSNDGVEVYINGKLIVSDPNVHSDRLSKIGEYLNEKAGWQPLHIRYFQRKGSAALKLYWKSPGSDKFEIVPGKAYGYLGGE